ncbi:MAG: hypothetical protein D6691_04675 [Candidatus Hydrogenedentota bacterium]|uniref:Uncharacterized protein n=1 Tax=Sumerlaea chitinivorans TaxID=2250252 RepID=A0A2Z4Y5G5_SUMC1|nr:hypothetical protein BRCON_1409 [Candidatus Sumerlaea chitinivorans]MCX7964203.1 hypothetical protein [Candidatus Sumerlaea chitinivorans]RMH28511.1 MAG: hypothetical protein D6691_04675 [Candidatus Hydrogenedentota bacterium]GIX44940.1 MAG: hypothetical protein KatS3mg130_1348 [Candidatus Sumerlaea sp.]
MGTDQPTTKEQLFALLDLLQREGVRVWVHGGWALEALSGVSRPHKDIDLLAAEVDRERLRQLFADSLVEEDVHKLTVSFQGAEVEITFFQRDKRGKAYTITPRILARWSERSLGNCTAVLAGREIPIVDVTALYVEVFNTLRKKGDMLDKNRRDQEIVRRLVTPEQEAFARRYFPRPNTRWNRMLLRLGLW